MIRVIIVEDEAVIRQGIEKHVPWEELGIDEVKTAENAEKAFQVCESVSPDIIISDICMPGMNGITLCKKFRETAPESQIIFISGFSEKEYLMAAIALGAVSYVEKPISLTELTGAIEKAVAAVKRSERQNTNVLHSLLRATNIGEQETLEALHLYGRGKELQVANKFCLAVFKTNQRIVDIMTQSKQWQTGVSKASKGIHLIADSLTDTEYAILFFGGETLDAELRHLLLEIRPEEIQNALQDKAFMGVGKVVNNLTELPEAYQSAKEALKRISYMGWGRIAYYDMPLWEWKEHLCVETQNRFRKMLTDKNTKQALAFLQTVYEKLIQNKAELGYYVRNIYFVLDNIMRETDAALHLKQSVEEENVQVLHDAITIEEMHEYLSEHLRDMANELSEENRSSFIIKKVVECMQENIQNKELSIQYLADSVYLTPTYLSNLFKKMTGKTIGQHVTDLRMEKAQELLADPQYKLYQIAEMVGYEDANYFAKTFKKKVGMLPSQYRESVHATRG